jgi:predicted CoA-substrate-specific enzyme activase
MDMSLGLDIGAYAVKLCVLDQNGAARMERYAPHHGRLTETTALLARQALEAFGAEALARGALTGAGAQTLKDCAPWVDDMAALAEGAARLAPQCSCVAAIGAQSAVFLTGVDQRNRSRLRFSLNSSCAAGTGSFLDEQASRIGIAIEDYGERAMAARSFPRIAGRCSVFAKTDITHHQQEGTPVEEVLLGLAHAVARNYRTSVLRKLPMEAPLFFSGGVARNRAVAHALREQLGLAQEDFVTGPRAPLASALGAAALAQKRRLSLDMRKLLEALREQRETRASDGAVLPPLADFGQGDADGRHEIHARDGFTPLKAYLGVDVGQHQHQTWCCSMRRARCSTCATCAPWATRNAPCARAWPSSRPRTRQASRCWAWASPAPGASSLAACSARTWSATRSPHRRGRQAPWPPAWTPCSRSAGRIPSSSPWTRAACPTSR